MLVNVSMNALEGSLPEGWAQGFWSTARSDGNLPFGTSGLPTYGLTLDLHGNQLQGSVPLARSRSCKRLACLLISFLA